MVKRGGGGTCRGWLLLCCLDFLCMDFRVGGEISDRRLRVLIIKVITSLTVGECMESRWEQ
jgi:hypothetical protein